MVLNKRTKKRKNLKNRISKKFKGGTFFFRKKKKKTKTPTTLKKLGSSNKVIMPEDFEPKQRPPPAYGAMFYENNRYLERASELPKLTYFRREERNIIVEGYYVNENAFRQTLGPYKPEKKIIGVIFPDKNIIGIGKRAFIHCDIENLNIPDTVKVIGKEAFKNNNLQGTLVLPSNLEMIQDAAFENREDQNGDPSISSKKNTVTEIIFQSNNIQLGRSVFENFRELRTVILPSLRENSKILPDNLFANCSKLSTLVFPDNLEEIHKGCFKNCQSLTTLNFPPNLKKILSTDGGMPSTLHEDQMCNNGQHHPQVGVSSYFDCGSFQNCTRLVKVNFPRLLERIGINCFKNTDISHLLLPPNPNLVIDSGAFGDIRSLEGNILYNENQLIHENAFLGTNITLTPISSEIADLNWLINADWDDTLEDERNEIRQHNLQVKTLSGDVYEIENWFTIGLDLKRVVLEQIGVKLGLDGETETFNLVLQTAEDSILIDILTLEIIYELVYGVSQYQVSLIYGEIIV